MNGAEALIQTLTDSGVKVCFANPGTSEMQLVAAIDKQKGMRAILGLFEGVVTGAADGYGRMTDKPSATLLHLGPGGLSPFSGLGLLSPFNSGSCLRSWPLPSGKAANWLL